MIILLFRENSWKYTCCFTFILVYAD